MPTGFRNPGRPMSSAISLCMERRSRSFCTQSSTGQGSTLNKHYTMGFDASAKIKRRSEFGVSTLVPLVSDDVDIIISAAFERQS
jgi:hypothetical protein